MMMQQWGAAATDWLLGVASFACAWSLWRHNGGGTTRWRTAFILAFACEGLACSVGGFSWAHGINLKTRDELTPIEWAIVLTMVVGMTGEGIALMAGAFALDARVNVATVSRCNHGAILAFCTVCAYEVMCVATGMAGTYVLQPAGIALPGLLAVLYVAIGNVYIKGSSSISFPRVALGAALNVVGGIVIGVFDNRCGGASCITELVPWEASPCLSATTGMASCPLPPGFNHAAIMHCLAITGTLVMHAGLTSSGSLERKAS